LPLDMLLAFGIVSNIPWAETQEITNQELGVFFINSKYFTEALQPRKQACIERKIHSGSQ